jgi:MFS family permease
MGCHLNACHAHRWSTALHVALTQDLADRPAGTTQGWVLIALGWLSTAGGILLAPILPPMTQHFAGAEQVDLKIRLIATLPALMIAIFGAAAGLLADRVGRRQLLCGSVLLYTLAGGAPLFLDSLDMIIVSRALVGIAEAGIMSSSIAMIGDYFKGASRDRWFALQSGSPPIIATLLLALGGFLGNSSWRAPFAVYPCTIVLLPLIVIFLWEPRRLRAPELSRKPAGPGPAFKWNKLIGICLLTVFATSAFMIPIVQMGFLLTERGLLAPGDLGLMAALASTGNTLGSLLFMWLKTSVPRKLTLAFALFTIGFAVIALSPSVHAAVAGALIANLGAGCAFPTLITWALSSLPPTHRGQGSGLWVASRFLGQFVSPLSVLWLTRASGSLDHAILIYAGLCAIVLLGCLVSALAPKPAAVSHP